MTTGLEKPTRQSAGGDRIVYTSERGHGGVGRRKGQQQANTEAAQSESGGYRGANSTILTNAVGPSNLTSEILKREVADLLRAQLRPAHRLPLLQPFSYWERLKAEREGSSTPEYTELVISNNAKRLIPPVIPYIISGGEQADGNGHDMLRFLFPLSVDHQLIVLVQFNALRAMLTNLSILSLQHRMPSECGAAFNISLPEPPSTIPPSLQPTLVQLSTPHDPWIDMIPFPAMRDNLLLNPEQVDQEELCVDALGGLYEGFDEIETRGIIAWGEPWSPTGWEVSEGFAKKYGFLLRGCDELMEATQSYRAVRGEERLIIEL
ncbi:hypothetical protein SCUP234_12549 [Seiridium cupressi]